jgi:tetratricopeptide (TPR) repeat protein
MTSRSTRVGILIVATICLVALDARAQEPNLQPGLRVVARSPDFALRDGPKVISAGTPFDIYRVERVQGDRVRLWSGSREGDALAAEVVSVGQAEAYFSDQIRANPRAIYCYLMRCVVRGALQHDLAGARHDCELAIRLEPRNPWGYMMRGQINGQQGDVKKALADFNQAIKLDKTIASGYVARAQCQLESGNFDQALADVEEALRRDKNHVSAYVLRAAIRCEKGDLANALRGFNEAVELAPKSAFAHISRAECYASLHEYGKAMADANDAVRLDPARAGNYLTRAQIAEATGDMTRAFGDLNEAIRLDRKNVEALGHRASIHQLRGEWSEALADLNEVIQIDPKDARAFVGRGVNSAEQRKYDQSLLDLDKAISLDPKFAEAYYRRGCVLAWQKQDYAKALADFDEVIRRAPESPDSAGAYRDRAFIRSACSDERFRDGRLAVESATKACQLTQYKEAGCLEALANAHNLAGDADAAIAAIDKAIALIKPGDKRLEVYRSLRTTFQGNLLGKLGVEKFFAR